MARKPGRPRVKKTLKRSIKMSFYVTPDEALALARAKRAVDPDDRLPVSVALRDFALDRAKQILERS